MVLKKKIGLQLYNQVVLESSEAARESLLSPGKPAVEKLPLPGQFLGAAISLCNAYLLGVSAGPHLHAPSAFEQGQKKFCHVRH